MPLWLDAQSWAKKSLLVIVVFTIFGLWSIGPSVLAHMEGRQEAGCERSSDSDTLRILEFLAFAVIAHLMMSVSVTPSHFMHVNPCRSRGWRPSMHRVEISRFSSWLLTPCLVTNRVSECACQCVPGNKGIRGRDTQNNGFPQSPFLSDWV